MGHRIPNHKSKCKNLHGHTYNLEVAVNGQTVSDKGVSDEGMVIDYTDLKETINSEVVDLLDHAFMIYNEDEYLEMFIKLDREGQKIVFVNFIPTAENIAKWIFEILNSSFNKKHITLEKVTVYETPTSSAIYTADDFFNDDNA